MALETPVADAIEKVAVVLTWRGRIAMLRGTVGDQGVGRWTWVIGGLGAGESPTQRAMVELFRATRLGVQDLTRLDVGPVIELDGDAGSRWRVHTFVATTNRRLLPGDRCRDTYRWVAPARVRRFDGQAAWLEEVLRAVEQTQTAWRIPALAGS